MTARDDQDMGRSCRIDVIEGNDVVGLHDHVGRNLSGADRAEQAVGDG